MRAASPSVDRIVLTAVIAALALPALPDADACGPGFPIELLSRREATMAELPDGIFFDEVQRLVPAPGRYAVVIGDGGDGGDGDAPDAAVAAGAGGAGGAGAPAWPPQPPPSREELALYDRGAAAFRAGNSWAAAALFEQLLALPASQRRHRSTWAAYMLGRIDHEGHGIAAYRKVRDLVAVGFLDEAGLAASSLGQEARLHDDVVQRIQLYAEQAAVGHPDGPTSLLFVIRDLVERGAEDRILAAPIGQRLMATYLYTRDGELDEAQRTRIWDRLARLPRPAGADQLAAAAYRRGDWARAEQLVAAAPDSAVAHWVRAKLALRAGDRAGAERGLRDAAVRLGALPRCEPGGYGCDYDPLARLHGERAVLAVADGRFTDAMQHAWAARAQYRDAIYLAERVLTPEELLGFLAALPDGAGAAAGDRADPDGTGALAGDTGGPDSWSVSAASLRNVYARRLMRAGRYRDAVPFLARDHRTPAIAFGALMDEAAATGDPIAQARALYQASTIARADGLEILGTEHAPDWAVYGASYDLSDGYGDQPPGRWRGPGEHTRVARSRPAFAQRYHYRYLASRLAEDAADRLPHQSQAFAATLCEAARYVRHVDASRVRHLYRRYVADGPAAVDMSFGEACPDPQFERARRFLPRAPTPRWLFALPAIAVALAAALAIFALRRRRQRRFTARP